MSKAQPCPFCGADGERASYVEAAKPAGSFHYYECYSCKARGPYWKDDGEDPDGQMQALAFWNRRTEGSRENHD